MRRSGRLRGDGHARRRLRHRRHRPAEGVSFKETPPTVSEIFGQVGGIKSICQAFFVALETALLIGHNAFASVEQRERAGKKRALVNAGAGAGAGASTVPHMTVDRRTQAFEFGTGKGE